MKKFILITGAMLTAFAVCGANAATETSTLQKISAMGKGQSLESCERSRAAVTKSGSVGSACKSVGRSGKYAMVFDGSISQLFAIQKPTTGPGTLQDDSGSSGRTVISIQFEITDKTETGQIIILEEEE
ncbi:MAG: hypothetical protein FWG39_04140 [Alphaproteobacteria bacterium]|nr:hypothetical protein [Alphaproteobacteria bacterium]